VLLGINQVTGHPSALWIQPSHQPSQCYLDSTKSPVSYTLAMQSMVSTFIQHPSKYPSRYLIQVDVAVDTPRWISTSTWTQERMGTYRLGCKIIGCKHVEPQLKRLQSIQHKHVGPQLKRLQPIARKYVRLQLKRPQPTERKHVWP
jgi:hypothetical protein